jgi:hypothetical protein
LFIRETTRKWIMLNHYLKGVQIVPLIFGLFLLRLMTPSAETLLGDWFLRYPKRKHPLLLNEDVKAKDKNE